MLARKYDSYAWQEEEEKQQPQHRQKHKPDARVIWCRRFFMVVITVMATYLAVVARSDAMLQHGDQLVELQQQEAELISKNNELKIEVEQLKGPNRIIGLAEQRLGMTVARSNIYLKPAPASKSSNSLAANNK